MITDTGDATINLVDPHDNNVTGVTIPAARAGTDACTSLTGWSSYTEYGGRAVNWHWTDTTVSGPLGYGWLGGKQRSTSGETAAFTLMGVRYYNWMTGTFTGPDPVAGGNDTSYGYPNDPINQSDTTGTCFWDACVVESYLVLAVAVGVVAYAASRQRSRRQYTWSFPQYQFHWPTMFNKKHGNSGKGAKNSNRGGHTSGARKSTSDKHTKAQGHGGQKKWANPNRRPRNKFDGDR